MSGEPSIPLQRFLALHAVDQRAAIEADVADHRDQTPAERWQTLVGLLSTLSWLNCRSAEERARVLEWRDPPHPSCRGIVERLRR